VETHHATALTEALGLGWRAYYLEEGRVVKELTGIDDLRELELFKREAEAYGGLA
jgi:hypothetical protein